MVILTEKYRPKKFEDVIGIDDRIIKSCNENMPHFLFVGRPGTGKTTVAKIIINELDAESLQLNASDERGIDVIRNKVKDFAMTKSSNGKMKVIFLDESDYLTQEAQVSLRNLMETYSKNCRFILTGNFGNKFVDAIVSRCVKINFVEPDKNDIIKRLLYIIKEENIQITSDGISKIINRYYPDIRKCINILQELKSLNRQITENDINKEELIIDKLFKLMKDKKLTESRQMLLDSNVDYETLTMEIYHYVMKSELETDKKINLVTALCECNKFMKLVISKELLFTEFLITAINILS